MLEIIKSIITKWDPINLMGFAPLDEYDDECMQIYKEYSQGEEKLENIIYSVFKRAFGEEFKENLSNCTKVANEIETKKVEP